MGMPSGFGDPEGDGPNIERPRNFKITFAGILMPNDPVYELLALMYKVLCKAEYYILRLRDWTQRRKLSRVHGSNPGTAW